MGNKLCGPKIRKKRKIYNSVFDLVDSDGDYSVSSNELKNLSKMLLEIHIKREEERLNRLKSYDSNKYIYNVLDLKEGANLIRSLLMFIPSLFVYKLINTDMLLQES